MPEPHRGIAWDLLDHLREHPYYGKQLQNHPRLGDLSDARTLYVIDFEEKLVAHPPPYRIVYRLLPNETSPEKIQVIWAGPRSNDYVYEVATRRLGRL